MEIFSPWKDGKELDDYATISTTRPKKSPTFFGKSPTFLEKTPTFFGKSPTFWGGKYPLFFTFYQSLSKGDECSHINSSDNPIPIA